MSTPSSRDSAGGSAKQAGTSASQAGAQAQQTGASSPYADDPSHAPFIEEAVREKVLAMGRNFPHNMGTAIGIRFLSFRRDEVIAEMPVDERTIQPFGILHGGASVALAETVASVGAWLNLPDERSLAVGLEINANHLRPVRKGGNVIGRAVPIHRGAQTQVWDIEIRTPDDHLVCKSRCTMAIISSKS